MNWMVVNNESWLKVSKGWFDCLAKPFHPSFSSYEDDIYYYLEEKKDSTAFIKLINYDIGLIRRHDEDIKSIRLNKKFCNYPYDTWLINNENKLVKT